MTKNLNLGRTGTEGPNGNGTITLTSDDTDLAENTTFTLPVSTTTSSTTTTAARIRVTNTSGNNNNGTYYSWAAAVASTTSTSTNPTTSVCPKNWDLPTNVQYTNLSTKSSYSSSNSPTSAPSSFLATGRFTNGATFYPSLLNYGFYWSSTSSSTTAAYGARVTTSAISTSASTDTTYGGNKYYRKNIRCIASNGTATINYDGNGTTEYPVTGTVASQENVEINSTNTQDGSGFTRTGWTFNGWNTAADGTGTAITAANASTASLATLGLKPGGTITLYAQWLPQYTITYVNNCQTYASTNSACTQSVSDGTSEQKINLTSDPSTGTETGTLASYNNNNTWNLTGWKITGWSTVANNSDNTNTEYKVSSTYTVPSGSSVGSGITLYAHWVPIYTVQYDGNGSDNDSTGMGSTDATTGIKSVAHTNVAEGDTFDLFASNFKKAGYGFVGWSTDQNAWDKLTDNDSTNDAKIWGPNEVITAPAYNGTPITTLYAVWAPAETSGGNPVYLQGWTGCSTMTATTYNSTTGTLTVAKDSITALTDERDGNVYAIAKLADESCWMIENLRLADTHDESGSTVATTLTTSNTNIDTNNNTLPITNTYSSSTTSNSLSPSSSQNSTNDRSYGWCTTDSNACDNQSRLNTTNTIANITPSQTQNVTSANAHTDFYYTNYSYGNYYNWYSATAGYGTYSRTTSAPTDGDLCPAGWKLPYGSNGTSGTNIGNTKGGFYYLANQMSATSSNQINSNKFRMFPNNFIFSGSWYGGSGSSTRGGVGYYWSASAYSNIGVYALYLDSRVDPGDAIIERFRGHSVRCVSDTPHTVTINLGSHVQSITITGHGPSQTINTNGGTITLAKGKQYAISATYDYSYGIDTWSTTTGGTIGSTTTDPTTYTVTADTTLSITSKVKPYVVQYDGNGSDNDNTGMGSTDPTTGLKSVRHTDVDEGDTFDLFASNFKKAGYGFVGWSTDQNAWTKLTDNDSTNDAKIWGPNEVFTAPAYNGEITTLYAVWAPAETSGGNPVYLQGWTGCSAMTATTYDTTTGKLTVSKDSITALTDQRDNEVYTIAKLADENCWMVENLRLSTAGTVGNNVNDSSVTNQSLAEGYGGVFTGLADAESTNFSNSTTANTLYSTTNITGSNQGYRFPRYNESNKTANITPSRTQSITSANAHADFNNTIYSYGNYYTWAAAIADTTDYTETNAHSNVATSLCPSGWHLPYGNTGTTSPNLGGTSGGFSYLDKQLGGTGASQSTAEASNRWRTFPNNFLYSGLFGTSSASGRGSYGRYWSSTASNNNTSYNLGLNSSSVTPGTSNYSKYSGYSIRCVSGS